MRIFIIAVFFLIPLSLCAQNDRIYTDDDTLVVVGGSIIDSEKFFLDRNRLIDNDTVFVNKKGWVVESFSVSAFALGQKINLRNNGNALSDEIIFQLTNNESIFKFFYLKDIILRTENGKSVSPSIRNIKITFTN